MSGRVQFNPEVVYLLHLHSSSCDDCRREQICPILVPPFNHVIRSQSCSSACSSHFAKTTGNPSSLPQTLWPFPDCRTTQMDILWRELRVAAIAMKHLVHGIMLRRAAMLRRQPRDLGLTSSTPCLLFLYKSNPRPSPNPLSYCKIKPTSKVSAVLLRVY